VLLSGVILTEIGLYSKRKESDQKDRCCFVGLYSFATPVDRAHEGSSWHILFIEFLAQC